MKDILQNIIQLFSTRELATITLVIPILLYLISDKKVRKSTFNLVKEFLFSKVIFIHILLYCCIAITCYILYLVGLWRTEYLKDVICYSAAVFPLLWHVIKFSSQQEFTGLLLKQVKYSALISAYLNIYTFSYLGELLLQFILCVSSLIAVTIKLQKDQDHSSKQLLGCFDKMNAILGFAILIFILYQTFIHPIGFTLSMFIQSVALPIILTITIVPYLYVFTIYCTYDIWFVRLYHSINKNKNEYRF